MHRVLNTDGQFVIVPNGVLTSGDAAAAGLEWLYRITGQREGHHFDIVEYLDSYGFVARIVQESCPRSTATVIVAHKKSL